MGRPQGHLLNAAALAFVIELTERKPADVAAEVGLPDVTIRSLRTGHHGASEQRARQIAAALAVPAELLFPSLSDRFRSIPKTERD